MRTDFPTRVSYRAQREQFLVAATAAGASLTQYSHPLPGPFGEPLSTDVAVLGDPSASRLLVAISGTHGVEGFYGSNCQAQWLQLLSGRLLPADTAIVMIHLINPWGTAWLRRVNEDNIDLNRNHLDFNRPLPDNQAYAALHYIYACTELRGPLRERADALLDEQVQNHGWPRVMSIVEGGQHSHPDGLFYGGLSPSWSNTTLHAIIQNHLSNAKTVMCFDLHTGAGAYGHPMLLTIAERAYSALADAQAAYDPWLYTLLTGAEHLSETGIAATATGYTSQALIDALPQVRLMPFVIECGTYPGNAVHRHLRDDQWLHLHGNPLDSVGREIKLGLLEQFYPSDKDWQELVWVRTRQIWERGLLKLSVIK
ncbi:DUF2817 domain-containing protein [Pseudomonas sp. 10B1]|uniref:DUF2817 domain-containing protein n=1 Tax=unclassified Pseudomonas TaxID=196821 RepID=UPI002AB58165|nr:MULTISPECIES: DUF2817 domain-containing protein [unclassified Pseudomonas]MDY7558959.1 DUF2817 domain-containing protein [Pseudomonas sp. AB6]MEA9997159.1 DUF2817 domain-containing protein [Pseudomonas sp. AA4]MEB0089411.1 DUF2817 domain-containing protein [Pseudomonas sp. RTI1]MEB0124686.1 DUF2817 domain-containing protein [Pseudomonas sp. CCC1.2]MEB0154950.1 DUF2817 domain-containing protein [Pseudomonas sp. CCC4.3]